MKLVGEIVQCSIERFAQVVRSPELDCMPEQCQPVISTWLKSGLLQIRDYEDAVQRKSRKGLFVDESKRPGNVY